MHLAACIAFSAVIASSGGVDISGSAQAGLDLL
jgi:hypothetical protein